MCIYVCIYIYIYIYIHTYTYIHTPNRRAPQYVRHMLTTIKGEIDSNTIIVVDFSNSLTSTDRSSRQKVNKKIQALNDTLGQLILTGHFIQKQEISLFSQVHMKHFPG